MADKVKRVLLFKPLTSKLMVRSFLGLTGYYRRFIKNYARKAKPLTGLLKKGIPFKMRRKQRAAVEKLKRALAKAPVLKAPDKSSFT
jgi:hypothetical protein